MRPHRSLSLVVPGLLLALASCSAREGAARDLDASADIGRGRDARAAAVDVGQASPADGPITPPAADGSSVATGDGAAAVALRFGALADVHGATAKLGALVDALAAAGVSFYVVLGDLGGSREGIAATVTRVAERGLPVYVIAGNSEGQPAYAQALADVAAKHPGVTDLAPHGSFSRGGVTFVALAGYHLTKWLPADGFHYGATELAAVEAALQAAPGPAVLLSHGPPKSAGAQGIDYVPGAGNVGDPALDELIERRKVPLAICGHIHEAGQRAVDDQDRPVAAGTLAPRLRLNAGAVLDGKASLVEIVGGQARFSSVTK